MHIYVYVYALSDGKGQGCREPLYSSNILKLGVQGNRKKAKTKSSQAK